MFYTFLLLNINGFRSFRTLLQSHLCNETPGNSYTEWVEKNGFGKEFANDWAAEFGKGEITQDDVEKFIKEHDVHASHSDE